MASPQLMLDSVAGKLDNKVQIKFTTTTKGKVETFLAFTLENTGISNYSLTSGGDMPMELLSLSFVSISETFKGANPSIGGNLETVGYDLTL